MFLDNVARVLAWAVPIPLIATASYWQTSGINEWLRGELASGALATQTTRSRLVSRPTPLEEPQRSEPVPSRAAPADEVEASAWTAVPCAEQVRAHAIVVDDERTNSIAALRWGDDGRAAVVRPGDAIGPYAVWHVGSDRVWLSRGGRLCQVRMTPPMDGEVEDRVSSKATAPVKTNVPPDVSAKIKRDAADAVEIDRTVREWAMEDPSRALMGSKIAPFKQNGVLRGYRVQRLAAGSLPAMLGLREGDVVEAINGADLTDPQVALGLYARLPYAERLQVQLQRAGKSVSLDVRVR